MKIIFLTVIEYLFGSLMFSYWLGLTAKKDLTSVGDGNPGAYNLWSTSGYKFGLLGIFLEFMKGYFPLFIILHFDLVKGIELVPVAFAPILGHAFSPFLKFNGGKAIAVTFGVWSAVTNFEVSFVFAVILAIFALIVKIYNKGKPSSTEADAVMVVLGMACVLIYLISRNFSYEILLLCLLNIFVLIFKNKAKLSAYSKLHLNK